MWIIQLSGFPLLAANLVIITGQTVSIYPDYAIFSQSYISELDKCGIIWPPSWRSGCCLTTKSIVSDSQSLTKSPATTESRFHSISLSPPSSLHKREQWIKVFEQAVYELEGGGGCLLLCLALAAHPHTTTPTIPCLHLLPSPSPLSSRSPPPLGLAWPPPNQRGLGPGCSD